MGSFFIILTIPIITKRKTNSSSSSILNSREYSEIISTAETLRKKAEVKKAEEAYWEAIKTGENSREWQEDGPKSRPYKKLAKMYYHTKRDQQALKVLNRYIKLARKHNISTSEVEKLKKRLANGNFRRLVNKYS